jgi:hypothetical protein
VQAMKKQVPDIKNSIAYINCHQFFRVLINNNRKTIKDEFLKSEWMDKIFVDLKSRFPTESDEHISKTINGLMDSGGYDRYFDICHRIFLHNQLERFGIK